MSNDYRWTKYDDIEAAECDYSKYLENIPLPDHKALACMNCLISIAKSLAEISETLGRINSDDKKDL